MENHAIPALFDEILTRAVELNASDIHLEPREDFVRVRYRVDGLLREAPPVPKAKQAALISRVKVMVNLDIAESRLPQDGRTGLTVGQSQLDLRVSTLPTLHGEKVVVRLLHRRQAGWKLEELGLCQDQLATYQLIIGKKYGLVLVTGPTGSGKTTTLYATLAQLNSREANIMTIEDPIEYQLAGINQVQVNAKSGLTFARGLRSILRQDPDIIMIGEIRDLETARAAVQAALTGHLVFSTLHTSDAPSAVVRLTEMGIEKYLVEATVIGVVAQRLVRRIAGGGYKQRVGIFEVMNGSAPQAGMRSFRADAQLKIARGITCAEEIDRVLPPAD